MFDFQRGKPDKLGRTIMQLRSDVAQIAFVQLCEATGSLLGSFAQPAILVGNLLEFTHPVAKRCLLPLDQPAAAIDYSEQTQHNQGC